MSSVGHPAKFLDCCQNLECNSSRLASVFTARSPSTDYRDLPATAPIVSLSLPRFKMMSNYESFEWKDRATKSFRMTKMRKQQQEEFIRVLYYYLNDCSHRKMYYYLNGKTIQVGNVPKGLFLFHILSVLTRCPETVRSNREMINWAKSWANVSSEDENVVALKKIHQSLYDYTVRRIEYYKASLKEFIAIIERR
jgi:hypothetical protein